MRRDVLDLRAFYATPLGRAARLMLARKVEEAWGDTRGLDVLGLGYATPFLDAARQNARRVVAAMPATQGVEVWPHGGRNQACLVEETALPLANAMFDRVLAVHALEEADDPAAVLAEIGRVMAPTGRLIVAVASRDGVWAGAESTPFGHGRPFSRSQLERLIRDADLEPAGWTRALYAPPIAMAAGWAERRLSPNTLESYQRDLLFLLHATEESGKALADVVASDVRDAIVMAPARKAPVQKAPARIADGSHLDAPRSEPSLGS
ncbi:MAG: methyltransferase type 11 [Caulobacter sp. 12-67-6]|nr:MAG: methyltransferase type 11 [Caulobacter sp. 12-67-6]